MLQFATSPAPRPGASPAMGAPCNAPCGRGKHPGLGGGANWRRVVLRAGWGARLAILIVLAPACTARSGPTPTPAPVASRSPVPPTAAPPVPTSAPTVVPAPTRTSAESRDLTIGVRYEPTGL